jgi:hypothetical protein
MYDLPYNFIPVSKFSEGFKLFSVGKRLSEELSVPFIKENSIPSSLSTSDYGVGRLELLKSNFSWQLLLMKRNLFIYVFKFIQVLK